MAVGLYIVVGGPPTTTPTLLTLGTETEAVVGICWSVVVVVVLVVVCSVVVEVVLG